MPRYSIDDCDPPVEFVEVDSNPEPAIPEAFRGRILIHTVHDGDCIPEAFIRNDEGEHYVDPELLERRFVKERDWGADLVARSIAEAMGLRGFARVRLARVLMDFNRFPGSTPHDTGDFSLERLAISYPFAHRLDHDRKTTLLESYYDRMSSMLERELVHDKLIMIAVHTYDELNASSTRRPHLSILSSVLGYQRDSRMPYGIFDPMYPDVLGESTCSRILRDRVSLSLERHQFRVSHNYPYSLPAGCLEVRAQVWLFFKYLRERFESEHAETREDPAYMLVWRMLMNTNLRYQEGATLFGYLHRYRRVKKKERASFEAAGRAYAHIERFLEQSSCLRDFRRSRDRPSSLGLEVRKDLVCTLDEAGQPQPRGEEQTNRAKMIGEVIAKAVGTFLETDRQYL